jgi:hypothetical protein
MSPRHVQYDDSGDGNDSDEEKGNKNQQQKVTI